MSVVKRIPVTEPVREDLAEMRTAGIPVYIGFGNKSLKSQMRQANNLGVSFAFIFGDDEIEKGMVIYKDMAGGDQWEVEIGEVISLLTQG
jgi:histidyl-tRNA synthetase